MHIMGAERNVKLFRNGRSQAVRIPKEFELPGEDAILRRLDDGTLTLAPARKRSLIEILASLEPIDEDFPEIEDPPPEPFDL